MAFHPMFIFSPLIYLLIGFVLGKSPYDIKDKSAYLLTKFIIPLIIIHNISTYQPGVFIVILSYIIIMLIMLFLSRLFTKDIIENLCFCYLNLGWLGLPIVNTLFGNSAALVFVSVYVSSSVLGNSLAPALMSTNFSLQQKIITSLESPPVIAFIIGLLLIPFREVIDTYSAQPYEVLKFLVSFLGMAVLGMWLAQTRFHLIDFTNAFKTFLIRGILNFILISIFILICEHLMVHLVIDNKLALYLICILPPAANIIILETYYIKSGRSASIIACGTLISIIAISIYVAIIEYIKHFS